MPHNTMYGRHFYLAKRDTFLYSERNDKHNKQ